MDVRLIKDPPGAGEWNMSVDQALLDAAIDRADVLLRFYRWQPPTLSLGYFQPAAQRTTHAASHPLSWIRRPTGGGAIVHHHDLTYCLVAPAASRFADRENWVAQIHQALIEALADWNVSASLCPPTDRVAAAAREPFLCFQRRSADDVLLRGEKIAGSAQRRARRRTLVHGSILLGQSPYAPELPGILEIAGRDIGSDELTASWTVRLADRFGWRICSGGLDTAELEASRRLLRNRYGTAIWNARR